MTKCHLIAPLVITPLGDSTQNNFCIYFPRKPQVTEFYLKESNPIDSCYKEMGKTFTYQDQQFLPVSSEELFKFFSKPENLSRITPANTGFRVLECSKPIIEKGVVIKYSLKIAGIPISWVAQIEDWVPNVFFTDVQLKGPFAWYRHKHILETVEGGTIIRDELEYRLPLGFIGALFGGYFVRQEFKRTFAFRKQKMEELFA